MLTWQASRHRPHTNTAAPARIFHLRRCDRSFLDAAFSLPTA